MWDFMSVLTITMCVNVWRLPESAVHCRPMIAVREHNGTTYVSGPDHTVKVF